MALQKFARLDLKHCTYKSIEKYSVKSFYCMMHHDKVIFTKFWEKSWQFLKIPQFPHCHARAFYLKTAMCTFDAIEKIPTYDFLFHFFRILFILKMYLTISNSICQPREQFSYYLCENPLEVIICPLLLLLPKDKPNSWKQPKIRPLMFSV